MAQKGWIMTLTGSVSSFLLQIAMAMTPSVASTPSFDCMFYGPTLIKTYAGQTTDRISTIFDLAQLPYLYHWEDNSPVCGPSYCYKRGTQIAFFVRNTFAPIFAKVRTFVLQHKIVHLLVNVLSSCIRSSRLQGLNYFVAKFKFCWNIHFHCKANRLSDSPHFWAYS